jgi:hypothetical protein
MVHEKFGSETVIVNLDSGCYYSVQGTGCIVWDLVCESASEAGILRRIKAEYSGDGDEISRSIAKFLDQLVEEALVEPEYVVDSSGEQEGDKAGEPGSVFSAPLFQKYTDMEDMLLIDPIHEVDEQGWPSVRKVPD